MVIENVRVFGFKDALRGMRNPLNSWDRGDSSFSYSESDGSLTSFRIGPNDEKLCRALVTGGSPHRKFFRQIFVSMDITAPMYWWSEMDTYKIGTTRNSCSVQHKGSSRDFTEDDFAFDSLSGEDYSKDERFMLADDIGEMLDIINRWRQKYVETKDYKYFRLMRQFMGAGYKYKSTWSGTYENLFNIYEWRRNHKLEEWHILCNVIYQLPGMDIFLEKFNKDN
jgi:hypothetical protein